VEHLAELPRLVEAAARAGVAVDVAINAPAFDAAQIDDVLDLARSAIRVAGASSVIVADVAVMQALGEEGLPFVASTVFVVHNAGALRLLADLGASRVVLPRHLDVDEIAALASAAPRLPLEAIARFDGCPWEEGLCRAVHEIPGRPPLCQATRRWSVEPEAHDGRWSDVLEEYGRWLDAADEGAAPAGTSPLDRIPALVSAGVSALKVAGRQSPLWRRIAGVREVRRAVLGNA
jgi:putative protease